VHQLASLLVAPVPIRYAVFLFSSKGICVSTNPIQFCPWLKLTAEQICAGHWPLWSPYLFASTLMATNHTFRAVGLGSRENTVAFEGTPLSFFHLGAWTTDGIAMPRIDVLGSRIPGWT
jgi:hypothetical protein